MKTATSDDLTVTEAAAKLGVSPHRVREFIRDERLKAITRGPLYFIDRESFDRFRRKKRKPGRPKSR